MISPKIQTLFDLVEHVPEYVPEQNTVLYRVHRADLGPLHFSRSGSNRFDPPPSSRGDYGTCYLATSSLAAFIEVLGRTNPIPQHLVTERVLTEVRVDGQLRLANLTDRRLLGRLGPIPEVSVGPSYGQPQTLAGLLVAAGFDGIQYAARHDPKLESVSIAVFSSGQAALLAGKSVPIPESLVAEAEREFDLFVVPEAPLD